MRSQARLEDVWLLMPPGSGKGRDTLGDPKWIEDAPPVHQSRAYGDVWLTASYLGHVNTRVLRRAGALLSAAQPRQSKCAPARDSTRNGTRNDALHARRCIHRI